MNNKNVNFFEKNVEKIVLAVAAAGAAYLIYLACLPVELVSDDGSQSTPITKIEDNIADQVKDLQQKQNTNIPQSIVWHVPDFVQKYKTVMQNQPLPTAVVDAAVPHIGPLQVPPNASGSTYTNGMQVVTPTPVAPSDVTAKSDRQMVATAPITNGTPPDPSTIRDQAWVEIDGHLDTAAMYAQMSDLKLKLSERIDPAHQKVVVAQIQVQRREVTGPGTFSDWEDVPAGGVPPANPLPLPKAASDWAGLTADQVTQLVNQLVQRSADILQPFNYPVVTPGSIPTATPNRPGGAPAPAGGTPQSSEPTNAVDTSIDSGPITNIPQPTLAPPANGAKVPNAPVDFRFFDDSVKGGEVYQYRVRAAYVNPTYRYPQNLKDDSKKTEPLLVSDWQDATPTGQTAQPEIAAIAVQNNMYFYVTNSGGGSGANKIPSTNVRVFKRIGGKWYGGSWTATAGVPLAGPIRLVDQKNMPATPVETEYTVVDVIPNSDSQTVILRSADGRLTSRSSKTDADAMNKQDWEKLVEKPPAPVAPTTRRGNVPPGRSNQPPAGRSGGGGGGNPVDTSL